MTKRLLNYFIQGLLYSAPIAITLYAVFSLLRTLDRVIPIDIPGLGLLALISVITLIGFLGEFFKKKLSMPKNATFTHSRLEIEFYTVSTLKLAL